MTFDQILTFVITNLPQILVKLFAVSIMIFHLLFSLILLRQVKLMTRVVEVQISPVISTLALIHLLASVSLLIWTIIFL